MSGLPKTSDLSETSGLIETLGLPETSSSPKTSILSEISDGFDGSSPLLSDLTVV